MQDPNEILAPVAQALAASPPQSQEGQQLVTELAKAEQQVGVQQSSQFYNLAQDLDSGLKNQIGKEVKSGYEDDETSRKDWLEMHEFWLRLYMQTDSAENSDPERDWGATESMPILTEACDQFQARTYKTFFPTEEFVSVRPIRFTHNPVEKQLLNDRADRVGRHMSWQLGIKDRNYRKDKRALFLGVALHGSFFTKTYFDSYKKNGVCIHNVRPTDLVVDYNVGPKRIEDVRRKTHLIYTTVGETQILANRGYLIGAAKADSSQASQSNYNKAVDESQGIMPGNPSLLRNKSCMLAEQQLFLDIDDTGDFKPYIATIDLTSGELLRLTIDYEADPMGNPTQDYEQIQYYTHYKYAENPDGFYGLGLGQKIGDLNSAVNIGLRQMLDAATLANDGNSSGYISERLCMDGEEETSMTLGKLKKVPDTAGDIQNGIYMMKFPGPSDALAKIIELLDSRAQRLGSTTDATTGDISKNMQPTTVMSQIEQAMEQFSSVQMSLSQDLSDELQKVYAINQKHMPFVEYFAINGESEQITRMDYEDDMLIEPIFDPKFSTKAQKRAQAQAELQATMQNPLNQSRPLVYDIAFRRYLEALECENIDELLPPTPVEQQANAILQQINQPSAIQGPAPQPNGFGSMAGGPGNQMAPTPNGQQLPTAGGVVPPQNAGSDIVGQLFSGSGSV